jgi:hypothetical protein
LYECSHVSKIWLRISNILGCSVKWKTIVCGYIEYTVSDNRLPNPRDWEGKTRY